MRAKTAKGYSHANGSIATLRLLSLVLVQLHPTLHLHDPRSVSRDRYCREVDAMLLRGLSDGSSAMDSSQAMQACRFVKQSMLGLTRPSCMQLV